MDLTLQFNRIYNLFLEKTDTIFNSSRYYYNHATRKPNFEKPMGFKENRWKNSFSSTACRDSCHQLFTRSKKVHKMLYGATWWKTTVTLSSQIARSHLPYWGNFSIDYTIHFPSTSNEMLWARGVESPLNPYLSVPLKPLFFHLVFIIYLV